MKKIIVISDSHSNKKAIDKIFTELEFDYLIHLGDGIDDLGTYIYDDRVKLVRGNCDFFSNEKIESFLMVEKVLLFFTHGHEYGVKYTTSQILKRVLGTDVNLILYGHTHINKTETINGITLHNPGALSKSNSYSIITIDNEKFSIQKCSF